MLDYLKLFEDVDYIPMNMLDQDDDDYYDKIGHYHEQKSLYDCLNHLFHPQFILLVPSRDEQLERLKEDFFKLLDKIFIEAFDVSILQILNITDNDMSNLAVKHYILNFIVFLHRDIPQMRSIDDLTTSSYSDVFDSISMESKKKIFNQFHSLVVPE